MSSRGFLQPTLSTQNSVMENWSRLNRVIVTSVLKGFGIWPGLSEKALMPLLRKEDNRSIDHNLNLHNTFAFNLFL